MGAETPLPLEKITRLLKGMGEAPDGQLDGTYAKECAQFAKEEHDLPETLRFVRDIQDKCVFTGGASPFVMRMWSIMLEGQTPERDEEKAERRAALERWAAP